MNVLTNKEFKDFEPVVYVGDEREEDKTELYEETVDELKYILNVSEYEADRLLKDSYLKGTMNDETADLLFNDIQNIRESDRLFHERDRSFKTKTKIVFHIILIALLAPIARGSTVSNDSYYG